MWFLDISTLNTATPDMSTIGVDKWLDSTDWGGAAAISHHIYDPTGQYVLVTTYAKADSAGELLFLNADTNVVDKQMAMPPRAHSLAYPGHNR